MLYSIYSIIGALIGSVLFTVAYHNQDSTYYPILNTLGVIAFMATTIITSITYLVIKIKDTWKH